LKSENRNRCMLVCKTVCEHKFQTRVQTYVKFRTSLAQKMVMVNTFASS
jgi:hypothetical protein